jgi:hypothetical protein
MVEEAYKFADEIMPPDMLDQLRQSLRQLWVVWDGSQVIAAVLTRIVVLRSGKACRIIAAGGSRSKEWTGLVSVIEDFAKREGCRKVTIEGRPGWERSFKAYRRTKVVLEREL